MEELISNNRIIGGMSNTCSLRAQDLYQIFVKGDCVVASNPSTAEMCKRRNSFRDVNIAFANDYH